MPFPPAPYNPQLLVSRERTVTRERLSRYLTATNQDLANVYRTRLFGHTFVHAAIA